MSYWTHVNSSIRIDNPYFVEDKEFKNTDELIRNLFKTVDFNGTKKQWEECNVPCGSEGSLQASIWINKNKNHCGRYAVNLFGDLRDFEELQHKDIVDWINNLIIDNSLSIRDGVMTINEKVYRYNELLDENFDIEEQGFVLINKGEKQNGNN